MNETMLAESTLEMLAEPRLGKGDLDSKVRYLLKGSTCAAWSTICARTAPWPRSTA